MDLKQFMKVSKALADPQRFAILERIAGQSGELACKRLVEAFAVSQATISHHLKELANAGLIECRREGQCAFLAARRETLAAYQKELSRRVPATEPG